MRRRAFIDVLAKNNVHTCALAPTLVCGHEAQWPATLKTYAYPVMGTLPVATVDTALVLKVLQPIWATKTDTAGRVRARIEAVLDWAKVAGYRDGDNPAVWKGNLGALLPKRGKVHKVRHHAALPYAEIGEFMTALRGHEGVPARVLEFAILTAARTGEAIGARWEEVDLDGKMWLSPPSASKPARSRSPTSPADSYMQQGRHRAAP